MMNNSMQLVSIYVLTYNSANTVSETLDSVYALFYPNIELIISDDASSDDTARICQDWLNLYGNRFVDFCFLKAEHNTGVAENRWRAIKACKAEWIKGIAGDDALYPNCIETFMNFVSEHPDARMIVGKTGRFDTYLDDEHFIEEHGSKDMPIYKVSTARQQYDILLCWACIDAPAVFYHRSVFEIPELQNCGYMGLEDYPFFLRYTKLGNRIFFCDELVCKYRKSPTSLQLTGNYGNLITKSYLAHFFEETHDYYHGLDKIARYGVNIYDWIQCYTNSPFLRKSFKYLLYPKKC